MRAVKCLDEEERLAALHNYHILDTPSEPSFDAVTDLIARVCNAPIAVINLIDRDRQWFKSEVGLGVRELPLDASICAQAILQRGLFIVPDTEQDPRFADNPLVTGAPHLRFYAGALLETADGHALGTLCVLDYKPRELTAEQQDIIKVLAHQIMVNLELRRATVEQARLIREHEQAEERFRLLVQGAEEYALIMLDVDGRIVHWNTGAERIFGIAEQATSGQHVSIIFSPEDRLAGVPAQEVARTLTEGRSDDRRWHVRADGSRFWADGVMMTLRDDAGNLRGIAKILRDATNRKDVEDAAAKLYVREQRIAATLQEALLFTTPEGAFPGLDFKTFYEPASDDALVGGDFCDVFAVSEDSVVVLVGDVVGKGLKAAAHTAQIKYALRAFLREYPQPAIALSRLNEYLCEAERLDRRETDGELLVVLSVVIIDTKTGKALFSVAGAEPPLILRSDAPSEPVMVTGVPLGMMSGGEFQVTERQLNAGDVIIMVTDGITEARWGRDFLGYDGMIRLAEGEFPSGDLQSIGAAILEGARAYAHGKFNDDVCIALARLA